MQKRKYLFSGKLLALLLAVCLLAPTALTVSAEESTDGRPPLKAAGIDLFDGAHESAVPEWRFPPEAFDYSGVTNAPGLTVELVEASPVSMPNPFTLVVKKDGAEVSTNDFDIIWYVNGANDFREQLAAGVSQLHFTASGRMHDPQYYPISVTVIPKAGGTEEEAYAPSDYLVYPDGATLLVVNGTPVRAGETVEGVSLNATEDTVTLSGVSISGYTDDFFGMPALYWDSPKTDLSMVVQGENSIQTERGAGIGVFLMDEAESQHNLRVTGDTLSVITPGNTGLFIQPSTTESNTCYANLSLPDGVQLNLDSDSATPEDESSLAYAALYLYRGVLSLDQGSDIVARSNGGITVAVNGNENSNLTMAGGSSLNLHNSCLMENTETSYGGTYATGIHISGDQANLSDGSVIDINMAAQTAEEVHGFFASYADLKLSGGSAIYVNFPAFEGGALHGLSAGIVAVNVEAADSALSVLGTGVGAGTMWGIAYADTLKLQNTTADIILKNANSIDGIHLGRTVTSCTGEQGLVSLTDSPVKISLEASSTNPGYLGAVGIYCKYLEADYARGVNAKLDISTSSPIQNAVAIFAHNDTQPTEAAETAYSPENIRLTGDSAVTAPLHAAIDRYIFTEWVDKESKNYDLIGEAIYNTQTNQPVTAAVISSWKNPFTDIAPGDWFYDDVSLANQNGLIKGETLTTFAPYLATNRAVIATILYRMEGAPVAGATPYFTDLSDNAWYTEAFTWAVENGIFKGYPDGSIRPLTPVTREELATILCRYAAFKGIDVTPSGDLSRFSDANRITDFARDSMSWCVGQEILRGKTATLLDPRGGAIRAETATVMQRFYQLFLF